MSKLKKLYHHLRGDFTTDRLIDMGMTVGKNFKRQHGVILDPSHCWLITIGDDVTMAPRVHILAHDASTKRFTNYTRIGCVNIGDNVFIGASSVILPNVTIGDNVIIGANSTVTKDIPANSLAVGSPARIIGKTDEYIERMKEELDNKPTFDVSYTVMKDVSDEKKKEMKAKLKNTSGFVE